MTAGICTTSILLRSGTGVPPAEAGRMAAQNSHEINVWIYPGSPVRNWISLVSLSLPNKDADSCKRNLQEANKGNQKANMFIHHEK